jgi:hypothetical protein
VRIAEQVLQAAAEPPHRNGGSISHLRHRCGGDVVRGVLRVKETCEAPLEGEASLQVVRRCRRRERGNEGLHHPAPRRFDHLPKQAARVVMRPFARSSLSNLPEAVGDKRPPGDPAVRGDETLTASGLRGWGMAIGSVAMAERKGEEEETEAGRRQGGEDMNGGPLRHRTAGLHASNCLPPAAKMDCHFSPRADCRRLHPKFVGQSDRTDLHRASRFVFTPQGSALWQLFTPATSPLTCGFLRLHLEFRIIESRPSNPESVTGRVLGTLHCGNPQPGGQPARRLTGCCPTIRRQPRRFHGTWRTAVCGGESNAGFRGMGGDKGDRGGDAGARKPGTVRCSVY